MKKKDISYRLYWKSYYIGEFNANSTSIWQCMVWEYICVSSSISTSGSAELVWSSIVDMFGIAPTPALDLGPEFHDACHDALSFRSF